MTKYELKLERVVLSHESSSNVQKILILFTTQFINVDYT